MAVLDQVGRPAGALEPASEVEITAIAGNGRLLAGFDRAGAGDEVAFIVTDKARIGDQVFRVRAN